MIQPPRQAPPRTRKDDTLAHADIALRMGNAFEAEQLASAVLKSDKGNLFASTIVGRALMELGRNDEAISIFERAAKRHNDPSTETLLAVSLAAAGRHDDAHARLQKVTSVSPAFLPAFREYVRQLSVLGRSAEAIDVAQQGIALLPDGADLRMDLASLYSGQNNRAAARALLIEARDAAPGRADILAELATAMLRDGDYAEASDTFRQALALQPDNAMTRSYLAACQLELGQRDVGEASLRSVMNGRPHMLGRAIHALAASSHGRFFMRPSRAAKFLRGEKA